MEFNYDPSFDGPQYPSSALPQSFGDLQRLTARFPPPTTCAGDSLQQSTPHFGLPFSSSLPIPPADVTLSRNYNSTAGNASSPLFSGASNPFSGTSSSNIESSLAPSAPAFEPQLSNITAASQVGTMAPTRKTSFPPRPRQNGSLDKEEGEISERETSKPRNGPPQSKKPRYSPQGPYSRGQGQYSLPQNNNQQPRTRRHPFGNRNNKGSVQPMRDTNRPSDRNTMQGQNGPRKDPEPYLQASRSHEALSQGTLMPNSQSALPFHISSEERERAKDFILEVHRNAFKFSDIVNEGLDPTVLRGIYADMGIPIDETAPNATNSQPAPLQSPALFTNAAMHIPTSKNNNDVGKPNTSTPPTKSMGSKAIAEPLHLDREENRNFRGAENGHISLVEPPESNAIPAPPGNKGQSKPLVENTSPVASAKQTTKETPSGSATVDPQPSNRSDYLARLAAAKTKKPVDNAAPKSKATEDPRPATHLISQPQSAQPKGTGATSQAPSQNPSGNSSTRNEGVTKEQREFELARLRMQVLKSAKASNSLQAVVEAQKSPGYQEETTTHNEAAALMNNLRVKSSEQSFEEQTKNGQPHAVPPISDSQSTGVHAASRTGLPGLLLSSEEMDPVKRPLEHAGEPMDQVTAPQTQKVDQQNSLSAVNEKDSSRSGVESLLSQRSVPSRKPSRVSASTPTKQKMRQSLPNADAKLSKRTFGAPRFGSSNDTCIIEASDDESSNDGTNEEPVQSKTETHGTNQPPSSQKAPGRERSTPPDMAELSRKEEGLRAQEAQIQEMKKKIEMMEQRKKTKAFSSGSDTPMTPTIANTEVSDAPSARESACNGSALADEKGPFGMTQYPNGGESSKLANMHSFQTPSSSSKVQMRRAEIESTLTSADEKFVSLRKEAEAKAQELEKIREIIRAEEARKQELVDELESLGVDTKNIPEEALEPVRDKVVANLQQHNASETGSIQLKDSTESPHVISGSASPTNEQPPQKPPDADNIAGTSQVQAKAVQDRDQKHDVDDRNTDQSDGQGNFSDHGQEILVSKSHIPHKPSEPASPSLNGGEGSQPMSVDTTASSESNSSGNDASWSTPSDSGPSRVESDEMELDDAHSMPRRSLTPQRAKESSVDDTNPVKTPVSSREDEQTAQDGDNSEDTADEAASDEEYEPDEPQSRLNSIEPPVESSNAEDDEDEEYEPPEMPDVQDSRVSKPAADTDGSTDLSALPEIQRLPRVISETVNGPINGESEGARHKRSPDLEASIPNADSGRFTPYESPLNLLRAYRMRSHPSHDESEASRSTSNNYVLDQQKTLCFYELNGGSCNDQHCESQHFRDVSREGL